MERSKTKLVVVYGIGPQDTNQPQPVAVLNLKAALRLYNKDPHHTYIFVTGGRTGKSCLSEAEAMRNFLVEKGVNASRIMEDRNASNTIENIVFVANIIDKNPFKKICFDEIIHISETNHLKRIKQICFLLGITSSHYEASDKGIISKVQEREIEKRKIWEKKARLGLSKIPEYWLPPSAKVENLERFRLILGHERIHNWVRKHCKLFLEKDIKSVKDLSHKDLMYLKEKVSSIQRIFPS